MNNKYKEEIENKYQDTKAYIEHIEKTKDYSKEKWNNILSDMDNIFYQFSLCLNNNLSIESNETQELVISLKNFITNNFYTCTNEILKGLGSMYINDNRFTKNIDKHASGNALYVHKAIEHYCNKNS